MRNVLSLMKLYAVEILSIVMGLWLFWIMIIYAAYIRRLKKKAVQDRSVSWQEQNLQEARSQRERVYTIAVTFPSYFIFWVVVAIWGLSYLIDSF